MEQEIYYKAELLIDDIQEISDIERLLKERFLQAKIIKVKGNYLTLEFYTSYNAKFSREDIESFIYVELTKLISFHELNLICLKEEKDIYQNL